MIGCLLGAAFSVISAIGSLSYKESEWKTAKLCRLPSNVLYNYEVIGRTNLLGEMVSSKWLDIYYYGQGRDFALKTLARYDNLLDAFLKAEANGFNLHLADPSHPDQDILMTIQKWRDECGDSERRAQFSERFKDSLQYLGLMTLLLLSAWLVKRFMDSLGL